MKTLQQIREATERGFIVVHPKKGKLEVKAGSSYEAAQKAAKQWKLKSTSGIDAYLAENVNEASGGKEAYQKFFNSMLKKFGVKSQAELEGDKKKKFYDAIDAGWEGDNEEPEPGDKKEQMELEKYSSYNKKDDEEDEE